MKIRLCNVQSIIDATYDLPDKGVVQIVGGNSNGKSIVMRAVSWVATMKIKNKEYRNALIRDRADYANIGFYRDNMSLIMKLGRESGECVFKLTRNDGTSVVRTFRDRGIEELIYEFGFRVYDNNNLCLNIYETYGLMPFINVSDSVNYQIVESVTSDSTAATFLKNYKEVTFPLVKKTKSDYEFKINTLTQSRKSLVTYDWRAYVDILQRLEDIYKVLEYVEPVKILPLTEYHNMQVIELDIPEITDISKYQTFDIFENVEDITGLCEELHQLVHGKCPTCGREFTWRQ